MGANSAISWTTHTFNPWWGCVEVAPECDNCYARDWANGLAGKPGLWGPPGEAQRLLMGDAYWKQLPKWQRAAAAAGERHRVFVASMSDILEGKRPQGLPYIDDLNEPQLLTIDHVLQNARERLWAQVDECPDLDFLLLTKRPQNYLHMVPESWLQRWDSWPSNVWPGTTVGLQSSAWKLDHLVKVPAWIKWVSAEPLLGPLDLTPWLHCCPSCGSPRAEGMGGCYYCANIPEVNGLAWIIAGGESGGPDERRLVSRGRMLDGLTPWPEHAPVLKDGWVPTTDALDTVRSLRDQAQAANVAFHFKQWGGPKPTSGGRLLDGRTWDEVPTLR